MTQKKPKAPTIIDVARRADVSLSTVSRVMNGHPSVAPALARRVREAATELGYRASPLARSLVLGRTQTVSVVVPDLANPTFQAMLRGLSRAAAADDYHVLIADSAEEVARETAIAEASRRRTDGIVLCAPRMPADELDALLPRLAPSVLINRTSPGASSISADYGAGFTALLDHVYDLGHRRAIFLAGTTRSSSGQARQSAVDAFVAAHPDLAVTAIETGTDFDAGAASAEAVATSGATVALAFNDLVAMGLVSALGARGIRVPDDISVTGFDDIPFAKFVTPPLTTAAVPGLELGADAWGMLQQLLDGGEPAEPRVRRPALVARASTAPPHP